MQHHYRSAIIHLSDIECGENNRGDRSRYIEGYTRCAKLLVDDLKEILFDEEEYHFSPADVGLIVSGDVAGKGKKTEYKEAFALLQDIREQVGIPPSQVAIVPGNHDVNWNACGKAFREANQQGEACEMPAKVSDFSAFLQKLCGKTLEPESVLSFDGFARLGVALVGFDSTYRCTFKKGDNYGWFRYEPIAKTGQEVLRRLLQQNKRLIPIAVLHHNLMPLYTGDPSYLHNHEETRKWLVEAGFAVCMCGHEHRTSEVDDTYDGIRVSVTGSFGLNTETLAESKADTNKYRIVLVNPEGESRILLRELNPSGSFDGKWQPDSRKESVEVRFRRPELPEMPAEKLRDAVRVRASRLVDLCDGRFVVAFRLESTKEALSCINSVVYNVEGSQLFADNRESGFLFDTIISSNKTCVNPIVESTSGPVPLAPVHVAP